MMKVERVNETANGRARMSTAAAIVAARKRNVSRMASLLMMPWTSVNEANESAANKDSVLRILPLSAIMETPSRRLNLSRGGGHL